MNVVFANVPKEVLLNVKDVEVVDDLSKTVGLKKPIEDINKFLNKIGIKI